MRGSIGFAIMLVVNPFLILFFQNCSMGPMGAQAEYHKPVSAILAAQRSPAMANETASHEPACTQGKSCAR